VTFPVGSSVPGNTPTAVISDEAAAEYNPAANDYDLAKDPRCLYGWGGVASGCVHAYGHFCSRAVGHRGRCGTPGLSKDYPCDTRQRPRHWDTTGRIEANH
jgi:hypothetical protein